MTAVAVAVINFNTREHLRACLTTVAAESPPEVVVVDNGSTDGSIEMVRRDFPGVTLHVDPRNRGYGAASNEAIARCTAPYVLLLNSDTLLPPGALAALASHLDRHPRAAVVGPRLVNPDGTLQPSCFAFPSPLGTLLENARADKVVRRIPRLRERYLRTWSHARAREVPWVMGAALAIRRQAFDAVGGFDESFFMYFEEVDLSYRLRAAGWETHFAPVTDVIHAGGASTAQWRTDMYARLFLSSMHYYEMHHSRLRSLGAAAVVKLSMLARLARDTTRFHATRDAGRRAELTERMVAWRRVLRGPWRLTH
ncbi:MAG: glycosyltransferase family 2 protein [Gemmatimonadaceae bacterium]